MASNDETLRNESVDQIYKQGDQLSPVPAAPYVEKILGYTDAVIQCAMDSVGLRLRNVAQQLDLKHPEIGSVLKGVFSDEVLSKRICDYLELAKHAIDQGLTEVQLHRSTLTKAPSALRSIDSAEKNQQLIRLLADRSLRDKVRGTKEVRPVEMRYLLKKGKSHWAQMPMNFSYYTRYSDAYKKDIEASQLKMSVYDELGCKAMSSMVESRITSFADQMEDSFCGFHRIKMGDAAAIAGKSFGASVNTSTYNSPNIRVSYTKIAQYLFIDPEGEYTPTKPTRTYKYVARAYPYVTLEDIASANMKRAIEYLEKFPEAGGQPLFDHYIVVVPSVVYPHEPNKVTQDSVKYAFTKDGSVQAFENQEECAKQLDRTMIQNGDTCPVLLGERDGNCYFICYWI